ncbi:Hypothetical protein ORPV_691 [Orpheovirus IHUMI-LCC2]|uniref:Uncharacterized protein n=1 Tax=Orpheovirus IHUMI-LCC2 TaxID=2023057 RepID=A0A2I2L4W3_9VIRU|nr:Hypothetical protein ORPV_691 [Orpheovirus IHUMI-LCC2]SNW62595.1 Hypothetical protein ORPV_691 [Orpheovirus IHUMI-LCC2]
MNKMERGTDNIKVFTPFSNSFDMSKKGLPINRYIEVIETMYTLSNIYSIIFVKKSVNIRFVLPDDTVAIYYKQANKSEQYTFYTDERMDFDYIFLLDGDDANSLLTPEFISNYERLRYILENGINLYMDRYPEDVTNSNVPLDEVEVEIIDELYEILNQSVSGVLESVYNEYYERKESETPSIDIKSTSYNGMNDNKQSSSRPSRPLVTF